MKLGKSVRIFWIIPFVLLIVGCSAFPGGETPTPVPEPVDDFVPIVSATGVVVPEQWARLSMTGSGVVTEVAVEEDQMVSLGETMVRLEGQEALEAAISAANFELASAEHALEALYKDTELLAAQAHQAMIIAQQEVEDAEQYLVNLQSPAPKVDIDQAKANLLLAKIRLDDTREDFEPYEKKPESNKTRAALFSQLAEAQKLYDGTVRRLNNLSGEASELDIAEAEADLLLAQEQLAVAERDYEIYKNGPDPDDVKLAEERVQNAEVQLNATVKALDDLELNAPFDGTVSELFVKESEWIAPGQPILLLADLENLRVETTDLNEIDVARIEIGDTAIVNFDALPDVVVEGKVIRVAQKAAEGSGVNYTVVVLLDEIPEKLRWGMTAFVDVEVE
ncbi:MAG: HlyD family efflux transporter periplasmic adaptor subunit [Anaerolineales bacterium]|nr:HlyD family efflux transporter periplasmic adaptor subunit [Anaerolineales bacterium]MCK5315469.1 HlyD family efflux transporter periplasmic adaptor subunit [Anaerolineales bacterium]